MGSDCTPKAGSRSRTDFNPRSPCGERRGTAAGAPTPPLGFQSTLPVWGATLRYGRGRRTGGHFNPRSPCGERPGEGVGIDPPGEISIHAPRVGSDNHRNASKTGKRIISIHAPRVGSDITGRVLVLVQNPFQSTLPVWGATSTAVWYRTPLPISIHAPRVGSDRAAPAGIKENGDFNPRSPCGERHQFPARPERELDFNPRSPCGERPAVCLKRRTP